jgi:hypothetical protein
LVSKKERDEGWRRCEVYRRWLVDKVFRVGDERVARVMILPVGVGTPSYRDAELPYVLCLT